MVLFLANRWLCELLEFLNTLSCILDELERFPEFDELVGIFTILLISSRICINKLSSRLIDSFDGADGWEKSGIKEASKRFSDCI